MTSEKKYVGFFTAGISASFFLGVAIASPFWSFISDRLGRRKILLFCQFSNFFFSILLMFTFNYYYLCFMRLLMGLFTGVLPVVKTQLGENKRIPKKLLIYAFAGIQIGTGISNTIGPVLGGFLSRPIHQYSYLFTENASLSFFKPFFEIFPISLPFFCVACVNFVGVLLVIFFMEETNERILSKELKRKKDRIINYDLNVSTYLSTNPDKEYEVVNSILEMELGDEGVEALIEKKEMKSDDKQNEGGFKIEFYEDEKKEEEIIVEEKDEKKQEKKEEIVVEKEKIKEKENPKKKKKKKKKKGKKKRGKKKKKKRKRKKLEKTKTLEELEEIEYIRYKTLRERELSVVKREEEEIENDLYKIRFEEKMKGVDKPYEKKSKVPKICLKCQNSELCKRSPVLVLIIFFLMGMSSLLLFKTLPVLFTLDYESKGFSLTTREVGYVGIVYGLSCIVSAFFIPVLLRIFHPIWVLRIFPLLFLPFVPLYPGRAIFWACLVSLTIVRAFFLQLLYADVLFLTNNTVSNKSKATIQGIACMLGAYGKCFGPFVGNILLSAGAVVNFFPMDVHICLIFTCCGLVVISILAFFLPLSLKTPSKEVRVDNSKFCEKYFGCFKSKQQEEEIETQKEEKDKVTTIVNI